MHADRQVLIGGLGIGFTLQETLEHAVSKVDIVEISNFRDIEEFMAPVPDTEGRPRNDYVYRGIRG